MKKQIHFDKKSDISLSTQSLLISSHKAHIQPEKNEKQQQRNKTKIQCYEELPDEIDIMKVFNYKDHDKARLFYLWGLW